MGITWLYIVLPLILVALVSFVLTKLPPPVQPASRRPGVSTRRVRKAAPVFTRADSWPDLESLTLYGDEPLGQAQRSGTKDKSDIEAPASVWKPARQTRLN
jgi:hypothetical protein